MFSVCAAMNQCVSLPAGFNASTLFISISTCPVKDSEGIHLCQCFLCANALSFAVSVNDSEIPDCLGLFNIAVPASRLWG